MLAAMLGRVRVTWAILSLKARRGQRGRGKELWLGIVYAVSPGAPGEAVSESAFQLQQRPPALGRSQFPGLTTKKSSHGVKPAGAWRTSSVCCRGRGQRPDPREAWEILRGS